MIIKGVDIDTSGNLENITDDQFRIIFLAITMLADQCGLNISNSTFKRTGDIVSFEWAVDGE